LTHPFDSRAIWNLPLGRDAQLRPVQLSTGVVNVTPSILVIAPDAPLVHVRKNRSWQNTRCELDGAVQLSVPLPSDFVVAGIPAEGFAPANAAAILRADRQTFEQLEPFARCDASRAATAINVYAPIDARDAQGIAGGHVGSGLSVLGGVIRIGELAPDHGRIRHALKVAIPNRDLSPDGPGVRWPATSPHAQWKTRHTGTQPALQPGALLALPLDFDSESLESPAARQIGWTLRHFGAYVVQGNAGAVIDIFVERGPNGDVQQAYEEQWEARMAQGDEAWRTGMQAILDELRLVHNWDQALYQQVARSAGQQGAGGGAPLASWVAPLQP
jgi:hypothetical protein